MFSNLVSFDEIIEGVKDATSISNLHNDYSKIRRFVHRIERDIGFGSAAVLKKVKYTLNDRYQIRIPDDLVAIEAIGSCKEGLCPGDYIIQGNFIFICNSNIKEFTLVYYSLLCDGSGNPVTTQNHYEAIIAGIVYFLYKPRRFRDKGSQSQLKDYEEDFYDRVAEARGDDAFPTTEQEWNEISAQLIMGAKQTYLYDKIKKCFSCLSKKIVDNGQQSLGMIYYWQFDNLTQKIDFAPDIDQAFLDTCNSEATETFLDGNLISYEKIGRIGFAIPNVTEDKYRITDVFFTDITDIVFDTYYNPTLQMQIYISKQYYAFGNIFFKFVNS